MEKEEFFYDGVEKLVVCVDIGDTKSAVSICHLHPGTTPRVRVVSRWPGSPNSGKIPSLILYDETGVARAFGACALDESNQEQAETEGWVTCKNWRLWLQLQPEPATSPTLDLQPPTAIACKSSTADSSERENRGLGAGGGSVELWPLPTGVDIEKVYEDWLRFLVESSRVWWKDFVYSGDQIWKRLENNMVFVLTHPSGWGFKEQMVLRKALANAIPETALVDPTATDRIVFVSEAIATAYFCLQYYSPWSTTDNAFTPGSSFALVDAGSSLTEITDFVVEEATPNFRIREVKPSAGVPTGSDLVSTEAFEIIQDQLSGSRYGNVEYLKQIVTVFDSKTRLVFDDPSSDHMIKFGFDADNDEEFGVRRGRLILKGSDVLAAFQASTNLILEAVDAQVSGHQVKSVLLAGSFGESPYLQRRFREVFTPRKIEVITPDEPYKKAVIEGAGLFYIRSTAVDDFRAQQARELQQLQAKIETLTIENKRLRYEITELRAPQEKTG